MAAGHAADAVLALWPVCAAVVEAGAAVVVAGALGATVNKKRQRDADHQAKVCANEAAVLQGADALDPADKSETAEYIRGVAEDIRMRRAGHNQGDVN